MPISALRAARCAVAPRNQPAGVASTRRKRPFSRKSDANSYYFNVFRRRGGRPCPPAENVRFHGNPMRNRNILEGGQSRPPLQASLKGYATQAADRRFQEGKQGRPAHALRYEGESTEWPRRHHCRIASRVKTPLHRAVQRGFAVPCSAIRFSQRISCSNASNSGVEKNSPSVIPSPSQIILIVSTFGFRLFP